MIYEIQKFQTWLKANGLAKNTIRDYTNKMEIIFREIDEALTEDNIIHFFANITDTLNAGTINNYRKAVIKYIEWKKIDIIIPKSRKTINKEIDFIKEEYFLDTIIPTVIAYYGDMSKYEAILYVFFYTGLRLNELARLKRSDFNFKDQTMKVFRGKQLREKTTIIPKKISKKLQAYFMDSKEKESAFNLKSRGIQEFFSKLKKDFPNINFRAQLLRHSFATHCLSSGIHHYDIKTLMDHDSFKTTEKKYLGLDFDRLINEVNAKL